MRKLFFILSLLIFAFSKAPAQFTSFGKFPVDIVSDQETRFVGGVAIAEQNVIIRYRDTTIYSDYAEYNDETRDVLVRGNVRIYREGHTFIGDRAVYNLETKQLRAANFKGDFYPFQFSAESLTTSGPSEYTLKDANFTTSDSSKPDYFLRAKTVRIYSKDHVVFTNVTLHIGQTPVFWWPWLYQSLDQNSSFSLSPGYRSHWGAFLLYAQDFPITENITGKLHLDYRSQRGLAGGIDTEYKNKTSQSWIKLRTYLTDDSVPGKFKVENGTLELPYKYNELFDNHNINYLRHETVPDRPGYLKQASRTIDSTRYRVSLQSKYFITDDIYSTININKLSDPIFLKDFFPGEYRLDPQPDNVVALTKLDENYTLTGIARLQLNHFFDTTERLPEFSFDMKRTAVFGSPVFYEGQTGFAHLERKLPDGTVSPLDYKANRFDSFHQFVLPTTIGNWLSIVPRIGVRGTSYSSVDIQDEVVDALFVSGTQKDRHKVLRTPSNPLASDELRGVFDTGVEASFKASREWNQLESRALGLDGLRHIVQPYTDFSLVRTNVNPDQLPQFDRLLPSDQLPSFTFPQYSQVDSISNWTVWRMGVRNRLQTRRDDQTINWLQLDSYFDVNITKPTFPGANIQQGDLSNLYNKLTFNPVPWMNLRIDSQIPLTSSGFWEANSTLNFFPAKDLALSIGHRYMSGNPFFTDSSLVTVGGYYQVNENWGVSATEEYEFKFHTLEWQRYEIHRDLSSWIASVGLAVRDNSPNATEYAVLVTFTLKAFPIVNLPLSYDPSSTVTP